MKLIFFLPLLLGHYLWAFEGFEKADVINAKVIQLNAQTLKEKKATVLIFLSARCPCSHSHIEEIKELNSIFKEQIRFIAIHSNQNETLEESKKYFSQVNLGFPVVDDVNAAIADQYKAFKTPHAFVLDPNGEIIYRGGVSSSQHFDTTVKKYLRDILTDISQGQKPRMTESKSLGCVILRKGGV